VFASREGFCEELRRSASGKDRASEAAIWAAEAAAVENNAEAISAREREKRNHEDMEREGET